MIYWPKLLSEKKAHQQNQSQLSEKFPSSKSIKNELLLPSEISFIQFYRAVSAATVCCVDIF